MKENEIILFDWSMAEVLTESSWLWWTLTIIINKSIDDVLDMFNSTKPQIEELYLEMRKTKEWVVQKIMKKVFWQKYVNDIYMNDKILKTEFGVEAIVSVYNTRIIDNLREKIVFRNAIWNDIETPKPEIVYSKDNAWIIEKVIFKV